MKSQLIILSLALLPIVGAAQDKDTKASSPTDTTVIIKGRKYVIKEADKTLNIKVYGKTQDGDTINDDKVYEATYNDEQTTERRFEFTMPFQKKKYDRSNNTIKIGNAIYFGYTQLNDGFGLKGSNAVDLNSLRSWEIGVDLTSYTYQIDHYGHWGLTTGVTWGYRSFRLDGDNVFLSNNNITDIEQNADYSQGRLRYNFFRVPVTVNWQSWFGRRFYIIAGLEPEIRFSVKSKAKISGKEHTIGSDLNVNPVGVNAIVQVRYGNIGVYVRSAITQLFENNKGPKMYPASLGFTWFW